MFFNNEKGVTKGSNLGFSRGHLFGCLWRRSHYEAFVSGGWYSRSSGPFRFTTWKGLSKRGSSGSGNARNVVEWLIKRVDQDKIKRMCHNEKLTADIVTLRLCSSAHSMHVWSEGIYIHRGGGVGGWVGHLTENCVLLLLLVQQLLPLQSKALGQSLHPTTIVHTCTQKRE